MSKTAKNKRFVELQGVRVYYNNKDNTIQIITTDPDVTGKPFQIVLSQGTPTEETLRELLVEKEVLNEEDAYPQNFLPEYAEHPNLTYSKHTPYTLVEKNPIIYTEDSKWNEIPLGLAKDLTQVVLDVKFAPHTLVSGGTGGGKSLLLNNFLLHAVRHPKDWQICAIDLKKVEFSFLRNHPDSLYGLGSTLEESVKLLQKLEATLDARYGRMKVEKVDNFQDLEDKIPAIMFIADEIACLIGKDAADSEEGFKQKDEALRIITRFAKIGRAAGVFIILSTQRPDATIIPGELKANLDNRIVVGRVDKTSSTMTLGIDAGYQIPNISGRAMLRINGNLTTFQTYFVPNKF